MQTTTEGRWFQGFGAPDDARLRLVCFPHAGGAPTFFRTWQPRLQAGVELLAVCYPGHQERIAETPLDSMDVLADRVAQALAPYLDRPFALFGHSMGSAVAYATALLLDERFGVRPTRLFVSGRTAPHCTEPTEAYLADDDTLVEQVAKLGSSSAALLEQGPLRELLLPTLRADYKLIETYRPAEAKRVGCPIVAYSGDEDRGARPELMRAWSELTSARAEFHRFPGGHFYLEQRADELLRDINGHLIDDLRLHRSTRPAATAR